MSVIFGIHEKNQIVIAGDKRVSTADGNFISDDWEKVIVINDHLAFVSAGNAAVEKAIMADIHKHPNINQLSSGDLCEIIRAFYERVKREGIVNILALPFCCLIAGKNKDGEPTLISCGCFKMKYDFAIVPMALYPPTRESHQACTNSFAKNYKLHHDTFPERTIEDISKISTLVSPTGSKWTYNLEHQTGQLESF